MMHQQSIRWCGVSRAWQGVAAFSPQTACAHLVCGGPLGVSQWCSRLPDCVAWWLLQRGDCLPLLARQGWPVQCCNGACAAGSETDKEDWNDFNEPLFYSDTFWIASGSGPSWPGRLGLRAVGPVCTSFHTDEKLCTISTAKILASLHMQSCVQSWCCCLGSIVLGYTCVACSGLS